MSDRIAGIAAVGGASGQFDRDGNTYYSCTPAHPVRVLHLHAANDRNYPYEGGFGEGLSNTNFYPVDATVANWRERNNVGAQAIVENVTPTTTCYRYETPLDAGLASAPVALCKTTPADVYDAATGIVFGGGHSWPGGNRSRSMGSDAPVQDFSANAYLWTFLGH
jgi:polyhydroxybutyrate depolymerase